MNRIRRRLIGAFAALAALPAGSSWAQTPTRVYRVGLFGNITSEPRERFMQRASEVLGRHGFHSKQNLELLYVRPGGPDYSVAAREMVALNPDVIYVGTTFMTKAIQAATSSIPVVFTVGGDPVTTGLVRDLARPGGNLTGVTSMAIDLAEKWLQLVREVIPKARRVGWVSDFPRTKSAWPDFPEVVESSARRLGLAIIRADTSLEQGDLGATVRKLLPARPDAVIPLGPYPGTRTDYFEVFGAVERVHRILVVHNVPGSGVVALGVDQVGEMVRAMEIVAKVLKGARPADIPVDRASRFVLSVNPGLARSIGLELPSTVLVRADMVIQ